MDPIRGRVPLAGRPRAVGHDGSPRPCARGRIPTVLVPYRGAGKDLLLRARTLPNGVGEHDLPLPPARRIAVDPGGGILSRSTGGAVSGKMGPSVVSARQKD